MKGFLFYHQDPKKCWCVAAGPHRLHIRFNPVADKRAGEGRISISACDDSCSTEDLPGEVAEVVNPFIERMTSPITPEDLRL